MPEEGLDRRVSLRTLAITLCLVIAAVSLSAAAFTTIDHQSVGPYDCGSPIDPPDPRFTSVTPVGDLGMGVPPLGRCEDLLDHARATRTAALVWLSAALALLCLIMWTDARPRPKRDGDHQGPLQTIDPQDPSSIAAGAVITAVPAVPANRSAPSLPETIHTEHLVLRPFEASDGPALQAVVDPVVEEANGWPPEVREQIGAEGRSTPPGERLICDRSTGAILGSIVMNDALTGEGWCEVGWWLGAEGRGRGLGTEALRAYVAAVHAAGCPDVEVATATDNGAVRRVMEKLGATELRGGARRLPDGRTIDSTVYRLRPSEHAAGVSGHADIEP